MPFITEEYFCMEKVSIRFIYVCDVYFQYEDVPNGDNGRHAYALPLMKIIGFRHFRVIYS